MELGEASFSAGRRASKGSGLEAPGRGTTVISMAGDRRMGKSFLWFLLAMLNCKCYKVSRTDKRCKWRWIKNIPSTGMTVSVLWVLGS